jgi:hypothetical protein
LMVEEKMVLIAVFRDQKIKKIALSLIRLYLKAVKHPFS